MSVPLHRLLLPFHRRLLLQALWSAAAVGLWAAAVAGVLVSAACLLTGLRLSGGWPLLLAVTGALLGGVYRLFQGRTVADTATWIDATCGLHDGTATALAFSSLKRRSPVQALQLQLACDHLQRLNPRTLIPLNTPRLWKQGLITAACGVLLAIIGPQLQSAAPAPQLSSAATAAAAQQLQQDLQQLQQEQPVDKSLQEALQAMNQTLSELSETPGTPREAFAKLSQLEGSLQQLQQQLRDPASAKALAEIGEALQLSEDMQPAGRALADGDLQKAQTELQKLSLPEANQKTRRAIAEQLKKIQQQAAQSGKADAAGKAAGQMAEGLQEGRQESFREGTQNLAAEARRQAGQKKLSEMLQQQSESLAQLRADMESQAGNIAQGQGRGGRKAGKGSSGDPRGDASGHAATAHELRLKGENSGQGDSETEMLPGEREEQPAEREYRANLQRYESLQESSLDSEPVPPGQKQLIRRYFQLIRPREMPDTPPSSPPTP
ncbi:MAG: hypothetical protein ACKO2P_02005 [Planctomycetota bacterium]